MYGLKLAAAVVLCLATCAATAGDIYICKGAKGVKSYQNEPCPKPSDQIDHRGYSDAMARAPAVPPVDTTASPVRQRAIYVGSSQPSQAYAQQSAAAATPPTGYQCTAGRRTWMQKTPCPATYAATQTVDVDGYTDSGQPVSGVGTVRVDKPVQQQAMDHTAYCDSIRAGAHVPGGRSDASQSYERNKIKRNDCGG